MCTPTLLSPLSSRSKWPFNLISISYYQIIARPQLSCKPEQTIIKLLRKSVSNCSPRELVILRASVSCVVTGKKVWLRLYPHPTPKEQMKREAIKTGRLCPDQCGSVGWVLSHKVKGHHWFDSQSGHMPGVAGSVPSQGATRGNQCFSLFLPV